MEPDDIELVRMQPITIHSYNYVAAGQCESVKVENSPIQSRARPFVIRPNCVSAMASGELHSIIIGR